MTFGALTSECCLSYQVPQSDSQCRFPPEIALVVAGTEITPETAAGNNPSSLGAAPPVTPVGPNTPLPGEATTAALPMRAAVPAAAAGNVTLPGPNGPVPGANMTAGANSTGSVMTAGR